MNDFSEFLFPGLGPPREMDSFHRCFDQALTGRQIGVARWTLPGMAFSLGKDVWNWISRTPGLMKLLGTGLPLRERYAWKWLYERTLHSRPITNHIKRARSQEWDHKLCYAYFTKSIHRRSGMTQSEYSSLYRVPLPFPPQDPLTATFTLHWFERSTLLVPVRKGQNEVPQKEEHSFLWSSGTNSSVLSMMNPFISRAWVLYFFC